MLSEISILESRNPAGQNRMGRPQIAPIDHSKLRETAYYALCDAFTRGEFAPGDTVSLRDLAGQLGISMTPVREAVRRLVAEGALIDTPSRTLAVPAFDLRRMADLKAARLALESLVLDQAMARATSSDIDALEAILAPDPARIRPDPKQNYDFHFGLYRLSGSEVLLPMVEALWLQYGAYMNLIINHEGAPKVDEHVFHRRIVAALRAGDADAAKAALIDDIERSFRILLPES